MKVSIRKGVFGLNFVYIPHDDDDDLLKASVVVVVVVITLLYDNLILKIRW